MIVTDNGVMETNRASSICLSKVGLCMHDPHLGADQALHSVANASLNEVTWTRLPFVAARPGTSSTVSRPQSPSHQALRALSPRSPLIPSPLHSLRYPSGRRRQDTRTRSEPAVNQKMCTATRVHHLDLFHQD